MNRCFLHRNLTHHRRQAQNHQNIHDIAAYYIPDRNFRTATQRRRNTDRRLRHARPHGYNRQPDDNLRNPEFICNACGALHKPIRSLYQQHKANHQSHKGKYYLHHARSPLFSDVKYIVSLYPYDTEKSTVLSYFRAKKSPSRIAIFSESNFHKLTQQNILQKVYR